jgi:hypothetical protein
MDPFTIATTTFQIATRAWAVGASIYDLIQNTRVVSESVKSLQSEVTQLGHVCSNVSEQLKSLPNAGGTDDKQLLNVVDSQICECTRAMDLLQRTINGVKKDRSNFTTQMVGPLALLWCPSLTLNTRIL